MFESCITPLKAEELPLIFCLLPRTVHLVYSSNKGSWFLSVSLIKARVFYCYVNFVYSLKLKVLFLSRRKPKNNHKNCFFVMLKV